MTSPSIDMIDRVKRYFGFLYSGLVPAPSLVPSLHTSTSQVAIVSAPPSSGKGESASRFCIDASTIIGQSPYPTASGGLGDVYRCTWNCDAGSDEVAVKSPRFPGLGDDQIAKINKSLDREIDIWVILKHEYVLPFHGTVEGFGPFRALVSPWMPEGNLDSYLKRACEALTAMDKLRMVTLLKQITEGLKYLHDNNVIHGDLTSNNVLIAADGSPRLADFGISNIVMLTNPAFHHHTGAVRWAAPEFMVIPEDQITIQYGTKSSDIYALGGIMLQVLYGKQPYWWLRSPIHVVAAKYQGMEPINSSIQIQPHHLEFMRRCWSAESTARPSVEDVLTFLQAEEELLEESPSVQVHFIPAHTLPTPPQPEGVHKLNDLELSHHSRNVPSDHDETGVVSSSSSARPVSDLDVTFETIRQKDGAADRDEESEEDEFHDARTPQTENSEGNDRVRDGDQESDEDVDLLVDDISLQLSSLTPSWGPIGSVREIGGEDIEDHSSRSATILTSENQPILVPFNPKYTSSYSHHARLSVSLYPAQDLGPAVDDSDEYTFILRPLMEYTIGDSFDLRGISASLSSLSPDLQCAALQLLEHAAEWDSINFAECMPVTFDPVVELLGSQNLEVRYAALDTLKLFLASPRATDVVKSMIPGLLNNALDNLDSPDPLVQLAFVELLDAAARSEEFPAGFAGVISRVSSVLPTMPIVTQVIALRVLEVTTGSNTPELVKAVAGTFQYLSQPLSSPETTVQLAALKVLEAGTRTKDPELARAVKNVLPELTKIQSSGGTDIRNAARKLLEWGAHNDQLPLTNLGYTIQPQV